MSCASRCSAADISPATLTSVVYWRWLSIRSRNVVRVGVAVIAEHGPVEFVGRDRDVLVARSGSSYQTSWPLPEPLAAERRVAEDDRQRADRGIRPARRATLRSSVTPHEGIPRSPVKLLAVRLADRGREFQAGAGARRCHGDEYAARAGRDSRLRPRSSGPPPSRRRCRRSIDVGIRGRHDRRVGDVLLVAALDEGQDPPSMTRPVIAMIATRASGEDDEDLAALTARPPPAAAVLSNRLFLSPHGIRYESLDTSVVGATIESTGVSAGYGTETVTLTKFPDEQLVVLMVVSTTSVQENAIDADRGRRAPGSGSSVCLIVAVVSGECERARERGVQGERRHTGDLTRGLVTPLSCRSRGPRSMIPMRISRNGIRASENSTRACPPRRSRRAERRTSWSSLHWTWTAPVVFGACGVGDVSVTK